MAFSARESSADVASSKIRMRGFFSSARAMATRCFSPPESLRPRSPTGVSYFFGRLALNSGTGGAHARLLQLQQVFSIDEDGAAGNVVEPVQQPRQRGLARAGMADDGDALA